MPSVGLARSFAPHAIKPTALQISLLPFFARRRLHFGAKIAPRPQMAHGGHLRNEMLIAMIGNTYLAYGLWKPRNEVKLRLTTINITEVFAIEITIDFEHEPHFLIIPFRHFRNRIELD